MQSLRSSTTVERSVSPAQRKRNKRVLIGLFTVFALFWAGFGYLVSTGSSGPSTAASGSGYSAGQVCAGWTEIRLGVAAGTMTDTEVFAKLDTMKSNADDLGSGGLRSDALRVRADLEDNGNNWTPALADVHALSADCAGIGS